MEDLTPPDDSKKALILQAAFAAFAQYGFRRTSMEDIARAAGMSRPALYQHFRNKEAIARGLVVEYFTRAEHEMRQALFADDTLEQVLDAGLVAKTGDGVELMLDSPHGLELLELSASVAQDELHDGMARLRQVLADWLVHEQAQRRITPQDDPQATAALILRMMDAIKEPPFASFEANRKRLAKLIARGLAL
jgi:AcrR family transcriptional regulator